MEFAELLILAIGLSMDAFAISICKGLSVEKLEKKHMVITGLWFGGSQMAMPIIGYFVGGSFYEAIQSVDHWLSFALLLLIGFAYLLIRKVISARIPVTYILTVAVLTFLFPRGNDRIAWMAAQVFGGGLMLGAIFMATDYATSPVTKPGQLIFGIGCGLLTCFIRRFGSYPEGVCYSILIMNCTTWLLDKYIRPTIYGAVKKEKKEAAK